MTKYHVSDTGDVNICRADVKDCPVGGKHFGSRKSAQEYAESQLEQKFDSFSSSSKKKNPLSSSLFDEETVKSLLQEMAAENEKMMMQMSNREKNVLYSYRISGSDLNKCLRNPTGDSKKANGLDAMEQAKELDAIIEKFGNPTGKVRKLYRYIELDEDQDAAEYVRENFKSTSYSDSAFMSTTEDLSFILGRAFQRYDKNFVVLEVETADGISIQMDPEEVQGDIQSFEKERLLPRDLKFDVGESFETVLKIDESREELLTYFAPYTGEIEAKAFNVVRLRDSRLGE